MHLSDVGGRPHKQRRRGTGSVGPKVVSPLDSVALQVLGHELLFSSGMGEKLCRGGRFRIADEIQHL